MGNLTPNPLIDPIQQVNVFGKIITKIASWFQNDQVVSPEPIQQSFSSEAESRGYGGTNNEIDGKSISAWAFEKMRLEAGRIAAYHDYDLMDSECPEISAALDVIAEFSTQSDDPKAETFNVQSEDEGFSDYLHDKIKLLHLEKLITPTAREIVKYGGTFWELVASPDGEIIEVKPLPPITMVRNEDKWGILMKNAFTQIDQGTQKPIAQFVSWQIVHARYHKIHGRMYGSSLLESARRVYKQLQLVEDGMVVGRLYRSHARYLFQIPVEGMSAQAADEFIRKKKQEFRKRQRYNPTSGKIEMFDSPITADEDFFIGVRKEGVQAKVDMIQGQGGLSDIGDIEYLQNKLFSVLKVPKAILGFERDVNAKATLTEQDVNFARTLRRVQQVVADMIREVFRRVMITDGIDPEKVPEYTIVMPPVSTTDDLRQWQIEALKANVALVYGQKLPIVDREYIYKTIMELSSEEITRLEEVPEDELGIETMPTPNFGGYPGEGSGPGNDPQAGGGGGGYPTESRELELPDYDDSDEGFVRQMREALDLNPDDPIGEGELKLARMVRDVRETFGEIEIDREVFSGAFRKVRSNQNGHGN